MKISHRSILGILIILELYIIAGFIFSNIVFPNEEMYRNLGYLQYNSGQWIFHQKIAFTIFFSTVLGTIIFWQYRVAIAAVGIGLLLISGVMDIETTTKFMSIPTILFIVSMLVVVGWMEEEHVFEFWITKVTRLTKGNTTAIFFILLLFSLLLGGFAGEVTAITISLTLAFALCKQLKISPFPYLLALVFATNIGSASTLVGNPIGVYLAFSSGLGFEDFLRWATPGALISFVLVAVLLYFIYRKQICLKCNLNVSDLDETKLIVDKKGFILANLTFLVIIFILFIHKQVELLLSLKENTVLMSVPIIGLGMAVYSEKENGRKLIEEKVDWWSILFIMFLFAEAACLEYTGITTKIAYATFKFLESLVQGGNGNTITVFATIIILFGSGLLSGFVDNLPVVAALIPVVKSLIALHLPHAGILWWALLFGGCFGGNLTMIGSSANLIAVSLYEKETGQRLHFFSWMKVGFIVTFVSLTLILFILLLQLKYIPHK